MLFRKSVHLFLLGTASLLSLRCACAWCDRAAGAEAELCLCVLGKSHTQPSLGSSLESQPVEVARGALTLILGEFTLICPKWPNPATLSRSPLFSTLFPRLYK